MATISIALCTYNGELYLQQQLDSYLEQSRLPDELVVCDDRSSDSTIEIVERFAEQSPFPVRLHINERNLGSTRNFEKAIALCTGDLIFLSDQDDVWLPEKIETIVRSFAENEGAGLVFSDAELVDENLRPLDRLLSELTFSASTRDDLRDGNAFVSLLDQNFVTGATAAFRSKLRETISPTPENLPNLIHDGWIALSIAHEAEVVFVDEPLIKYRQHSSQQVGLRVRRETDRRQFFSTTIKNLESEVERLRMMRDIPRFGWQDTIDRLITEKLDYLQHCTVRMELPGSRPRRLAPVVREFLTGRYGRFSRGSLSAAKDLLEH